MKRSLQDISNHDGFESQSCRTSPEIRKRRKAMEKRRRDKINQYLGELSQLVPEAAEKVGCTKLEKSEVLEMTVDYVKRLVQEHSGPLQTRHSDPEMERKRGFLTCISHMRSYLEEQSGQLNRKDCDDPKFNNVSCSKSNSSISLESPGKKRRDCLYADEKPHGISLFSQQSIFNKICMDFLKNSSSLSSIRATEKQQRIEEIPWQKQQQPQNQNQQQQSHNQNQQQQPHNQNQQQQPHNQNQQQQPQIQQQPQHNVIWQETPSLVYEGFDDFDLKYGSFLSAVNSP